MKFDDHIPHTEAIRILHLPDEFRLTLFSGQILINFNGSDIHQRVWIHCPHINVLHFFNTHHNKKTSRNFYLSKGLGSQNERFPIFILYS